MAAVTALPLAVAAFAAVEYHHFSSERSRLQAALDSATLAVALSESTDSAALQALGDTVLRQNLRFNPNRMTLSGVQFVQTGGDVTGTAILGIRPLVSGIVVSGDLNVSARSEISRLGDRLEVALVLDNTYSMLTNNRIGILKTASEEFVNTLHASAVRTRVADALKLSVVPFSTTVNVGAEFSPGVPRTSVNSPWLDWTAVSPIHSEGFSAPVNRFTLYANLGRSWGGCVEGRQMRPTVNGIDYDITDTPAAVADPLSMFVPYFAPDEPDVFDWGAAYYTNNYLVDGLGKVGSGPGANNFLERQRRVQKYSAPSWNTNSGAIPSGYQYGPNYGCANLKPVVPLSTDTGPAGKVVTALRNLTVVGDTNIPIGMAWGWHTLSPNAPFVEKGAAYTNTGVTKIAVLMTDGDNRNSDSAGPDLENRSYYSAIGFIWQNRLGIGGNMINGAYTVPANTPTEAQRLTAMNQRLALLCSNMKAAGIVIYTVRVEQTGPGDLLRDCASDVGKYYDVQTASQLTATFKSIADAIVNNRIAR